MNFRIGIQMCRTKCVVKEMSTFLKNDIRFKCILIVLKHILDNLRKDQLKSENII